MSLQTQYPNNSSLCLRKRKSRRPNKGEDKEVVRKAERNQAAVNVHKKITGNNLPGEIKIHKERKLTEGEIQQSKK